jgi:hypothetical protein
LRNHKKLAMKVLTFMEEIWKMMGVKLFVMAGYRIDGKVV